MIVIGRLKPLEDAPGGGGLAIKVASYHRGHLSLRPGTHVFLALYPPSARGERGNIIGRFPELLGTTIHRDSWCFVFRVSLTLKDGPGVVHQVLESVAAQGGNVLYADSYSIEQGRYHQVEAIVDFRPLLARRGISAVPPSRVEVLIRGILLADCAEDVAWLDGAPKVRVGAVRSLRRMDQALAEIALPQSLIVPCRVEKGGYIALPQELIEDINFEMEQSFPGHPPLSANSRYLLTSDTKERTFHVHFLSKRQLVVWCAIRHENRPGALAAITDSLRGANITIISSLNRLETHLGWSWFEAVLACEAWVCEEGEDIEARLDELRAAVGERFAAEVPAHFDCHVYFDGDEANDVVAGAAGEATRPKLRDQRQIVSIDEWLAARERHLEDLCSRPRPEPSLRSPSIFASALDEEDVGGELRALEEGLGDVRRIARRRPRRLFFSIAHTTENEELVAITREICGGLRFDLDMVEFTERELRIRTEVRRRIEETTHFLAVWTPSRWDAGGGVREAARAPAGERSGPISGAPRPSPWCLWEIAVAEALARPIRVAIEDGVSLVDYEALYATEFAFRFAREAEHPAKSFRVMIERALQSFE